MTSCFTSERILEWYQAWNHRDWNSLSAILSPQFMMENWPLECTTTGVDSFLKHAMALTQRFPDGMFFIDRLGSHLRGGQVFIVEYRFKGTQKAPFEGHFCDILGVESERLIYRRVYGDRILSLAEPQAQIPPLNGLLALF